MVIFFFWSRSDNWTMFRCWVSMWNLLMQCKKMLFVYFCTRNEYTLYHILIWLNDRQLSIWNKLRLRASIRIYIFNGSSRVFFHLFRTSVNDLPLRHYTVYFYYLPSHTITLCYVVLHSFLFADMMHDFTIQKELGQLVIRISLVQGRYARFTFDIAAVADLWPSYYLIII